MKHGLRVKVEEASIPIDLTKWAQNYCRRVLELEGIKVEQQREEPPEPMKRAS
jgi:hypothetical protein